MLPFGDAKGKFTVADVTWSLFDNFGLNVNFLVYFSWGVVVLLVFVVLLVAKLRQDSNPSWAELVSNSSELGSIAMLRL